MFAAAEVEDHQPNDAAEITQEDAWAVIRCAAPRCSLRIIVMLFSLKH